jgi:NAD(P)H-hydrate epimerase
MKILSAAQTRELDAYTIRHEPVASIDLMERASLSFINWFVSKFDNNQPVAIFCGLGNNGGDGLAIARLLLERKYKVEVWIVQYADNSSADFKANYERLNGLLPIQKIRHEKNIPILAQQSIIIDAIFGSGLSRPVEGIAAQVIESINKANSIVVAVDIPSGLYVDAYNWDTHIIQADYTLSFQLPKLSFLLPQNEKYVGEWHITDIGLHPEKIKQTATPYFYLDEALVKILVKKRNKFSHKGTFGHALLVGGSYGKMGAAVLATRACLHSGVGLLTVHVPACGYEIMQISVPEAMTITDVEENLISALPDTEYYSAIGIGPGLGTAPQTAQALQNLLQAANKPIVIDADGLNLLSKNKALLKLLPAESILTPHPKEFERLTRPAAHEYERLEVLKEFAIQYQVNVVLKGAHTAIARPSGEVYFNSTGNPGMATGGSGDVLTGIITALLAQQYQPFEAALLGVYFHGLSGDFAASRKGYNALVASDLVENLSQAFMKFGL